MAGGESKNGNNPQHDIHGMHHARYLAREKPFIESLLAFGSFSSGGY
jgi:hypothetical protein